MPLLGPRHTSIDIFTERKEKKMGGALTKCDHCRWPCVFGVRTVWVDCSPMTIMAAACHLAKEQGVVPPWNTMSPAIAVKRSVHLCRWCLARGRQNEKNRNDAQAMVDVWKLANHDPTPRCRYCACKEENVKVCRGECVCHLPDHADPRSRWNPMNLPDPRLAV